MGVSSAGSLKSGLGGKLSNFQPATVAQQQALFHLSQEGSHMVAATTSAGHAVRCEVNDWNTAINDLSISYTGETVQPAQWLTVDQVLPGLPPDKFAASIELSDLCEGAVKRCLEDPSIVLKPSLDDKDVLPKARVLCNDAEWIKISRVLLAKGLVRPLREHELFLINGQPLLNGAFGVAKPGKLTPEGKEVQRFIMDLRPSNHLQLPIVGDIACLAGPCKWLNLVLPQGQVLQISGDDLTAACYLFRLPWAWHRLFTFEKSVRVCDVVDGSTDTSKVWLAATVMPMGWLIGCGDIATRPSAHGNGSWESAPATSG